MPTSGLAATTLPIALALLAGIATAYQPGINAKFAHFSGSPIWGGVSNFAVGLFAVLLVAALTRSPLPDPSRLAQGPWWMWAGGFCGAFFVTIAIILVPSMGTANYLTVMIAGQLIASLVIDHFGHLNLAVREVTPARLLGIALVGIGVVLVRKF